MVKFISKSVLDSFESDKKKIHYTGEIYPQIFLNDNDIVFTDNLQMEVGIIWLGGYKLDNNLFHREKCPICGKEEVLIPYKTIGSVLTGYHTINFYCTNCGEKFVTNNHIEYFRKIYKYIICKKDNFTSEQIIEGCVSESKKITFVGQ